MFTMPDAIEVYLAEPGAGRPAYASKPRETMLCTIMGDFRPRIGEVILLSTRQTGEEETKAYIMMGFGTAYRVLDVEHMIGIDGVFTKTWIHVRRISEEEYAKDPG